MKVKTLEKIVYPVSLLLPYMLASNACFTRFGPCASFMQGYFPFVSRLALKKLCIAYPKKLLCGLVTRHLYFVNAYLFIKSYASKLISSGILGHCMSLLIMLSKICCKTSIHVKVFRYASNFQIIKKKYTSTSLSSNKFTGIHMMNLKSTKT